MRAYERLLKYVVIHTTSDENSEKVPSTDRQFNLANVLAEEMKNLGIEDSAVDSHAYVTGHIPATPGYENAPKIGFIAHLDTAPDSSGENVRPCIHENYDGCDVELGNGKVLSSEQFPHLKNLKGRTLITTDGSTLLGADDKAGIAEIMTMAENILKEGIPHGAISIAFTPDEEIGHGAELLDLKRFGADFAYTVDGGPEGEVVYENFNACSAVFDINGFNIHPGSAKDKMINACLVAMEINSMLPAGETPRDTEGYEGCFHLCEMSGDCEKAVLRYIVRDHRAGNFQARQDTLIHIEKLINEKYGPGTAELTIKQSYRNMEEMIRPAFRVVETANRAIEDAGLVPSHEPIRGGTDGARLSFMGLPTPNLGTGGFAFHGPYEHISLEGMEKSSEIIGRIIELFAE